MKVIFWIKYRLYNYIPRNVWNSVARILNILNKGRFLEQTKSFGSLNPELTFYVIRRRPPAAGFFSNVLFVCQGLLYASEKGFTPVVDMENYWVQELSSVRKIKNTRNAWCYFFQQTSEYSLEEVYRSKKVIMSDASAPIERNHWLSTKPARPEILFKNIYVLKSIFEKFIIINRDSQEFIEKNQRKLDFNPDQTIGVFIRGTVYDNHVAGTFFDIPPLEVILSEMQLMMNRKSLNKIFLVTESFLVYKKVYEFFKHTAVLVNLRFNSELSESEVLQSEAKLVDKDGGIKMGYDKTRIYLTEISLLSYCKYFIGTFSNASVYALACSDLSIGEHKIVLSDKVLDINEFFDQKNEV